MIVGACFALAMLRTQRGSEEISAFRGLGKTNPRQALANTIMFASLAGVPLTAGFFAKMISFVHVISTGLYLNWMLPIMIICAAAGFYYYFKVIRSMYWDKPEEGMEAVQVPVISGVTLAAFSVTVMWGATRVGRLLIAFVFPLKNPRKAMVGMSVLCTVFYVLLVMAHTQGAAIALLDAYAISMSGLHPTAVASAGRMTSVTSMGIMLPVASSGAILMPWIIGIVAEKAGLAAGMVSYIVPCVGLIVFTLLVARLPEEWCAASL